jgi:spore maturation protein CgeB
VYGFGWPNDWSKGQTTYDFKAGCKLYRGAKIALGDSQWPESGFVSNRIFQILCTGGAALFHQWFYKYEELGLEHGVNCVIWKDLKELRHYIQYYLDRPMELEEISAAGEALAFTRHSFDARWEEMKSFINKLTPTNEVIQWRY